MQPGVELHVILLYRPLVECLRSDCMHRRFETCDLQADTLQSNANILIKQIQSSFDFPGPVHCFKYGNNESMKSAVRHAFSISDSPAINSSSIFDTAYKPRTRTSEDMSQLESLRLHYADSLAEPDKALLTLCEKFGP